MPKIGAWLSWQWSGRCLTFTHVPVLVPVEHTASGSRFSPHGSIEAAGAGVHPTVPANQSDIPHLC